MDTEDELKMLKRRCSGLENQVNKLTNILQNFSCAIQNEEYNNLVCSCGITPITANAGCCTNTDCMHGLNE